MNRYSDEGDKKASYDLLNEINQKFVDIIRTSGGNNEKRHLLIAGYNTDFELTSDEMFKIPNDKENRCAVSVHYYTPPTFALLDKDASWVRRKLLGELRRILPSLIIISTWLRKDLLIMECLLSLENTALVSKIN